MTCFLLLCYPHKLVPCLVIIELPPAADITQREKSKFEVSIGSLPLEIREPSGGGGGKNVGVRADGGHQENSVHRIN